MTATETTGNYLTGWMRMGCPDNVPMLATRNGEKFLDGPHNQEQHEAAMAVGYCNYAGWGVYEAVDDARSRCLPGWTVRVINLHGMRNYPEGCVRVGQVRVRQSDPDYPLIIVKS